MKRPVQSDPNTAKPPIKRHNSMRLHGSVSMAALGALVMAGFCFLPAVVQAGSTGPAAAAVQPEVTVPTRTTITLRARTPVDDSIVETGLSWIVRDARTDKILHRSENSGSIDLTLVHGLYEILVWDPVHKLEAGGEISTLEGDRFTLTMSPQDEDEDEDEGEAMDLEAMEQAEQRFEEASARGDSAAAQAALAEIMKISIGDVRQTYSSTQLRELIPDTLAGRQRSAVKTQTRNAMGMKASTLKATYGEGRGKLRLQIEDDPAVASLLGTAFAFLPEDEMEDEHRIERNYRDGSRMFTEKYRKDGSYSELEITLEDGFKIKATGAEPMDSLRPAILAIVQSLEEQSRAGAE